MVRYELAKDAEEYIHKLAEEVNSSLNGAELCQLKYFGRKRAILVINEPFHDKRNYFNGFIIVQIKFNQEEPKFLNHEDHNLWHPKINKIAKDKFDIDRKFMFKNESDYVSINFKEPSEKELYALTQNKKDTFQKGFDKIKKYIEWHCSAVKDYNNVIKSHSEIRNKYLTRLENLVLA